MAIDWKEHDRIKRPYKPSVSESGVEGRVMPDVEAKKAEIYGRRLLDITVQIDHLRNRPEYEKVKDRLDKSIKLIFESIDEIRA